MRHSPELPVARAFLRGLIALNWLVGGAILALLVLSLTNPRWTFTALGVPPTPETRILVLGMRLIAAIGLVAIPLHYALLRRLLAVVESVQGGDAFAAVNAQRLHAIGKVLLALQLLTLVVGGIGRAVSTPAHPLHLDAGFSLAGWLAVFLTFVLARVFAEGALMREDLAGTV